MLEIRPYEAILLAAIIAVSVLIIENIIFINNNASDPLNCNECKVSVIDNDNTPKTSPEKTNEPFIGNLGNHLNELYNNVIGKVFVDKPDYGKVHMTNDPAVVKTLENSPGNDYEYKCIKVSKNNSETTNKNMSPQINNAHTQQNTSHSYNNHPENKAVGADLYNNGAKEHMDVTNDTVEGFEQFMEDQAKKNVELVKKSSVPEPPTNASNSSNIIDSNSTDNFVQMEKDNLPNQTISSLPQIKPEEIQPNVEKKEMQSILPSPILPTTTSVTNSTNVSNSTNVPNVSNTDTGVKSETSAGEDLTYSVNYVQYQKDGLQQEADEQSAKINTFRRDIADQEAVTPWSKDGYKYYSDIFTRSVGAPPANTALTNELKYGDYNYIGPINKGMINKEYTFVSPSNWYPIPPHPPVCVTNKSCTTCPVQISNGKDYMQWAPWDEFDQARRFTGDMNINVDYVKNVLNNPNGF
jgi:hypothetical protein